MLNLLRRAAVPTAAENELADLMRRRDERAAQLATEQQAAAQVEADLLTGAAEVGDVTAARQRCAALQDAVNALNGQIDAKTGEVTAQGRQDEAGRILAEIGDRTRALEARRARCSELHDEGVEALRTIAGQMADESAAYTQERAELAQIVARLRELRAAPGANPGNAGEVEPQLPTGRVFTPRVALVVDQLSASVCKAFDAAVRLRVGRVHAASMAEVPQGYGPGGYGDPLGKAKGITDLRGNRPPALAGCKH